MKVLKNAVQRQHETAHHQLVAQDYCIFLIPDNHVYAPRCKAISGHKPSSLWFIYNAPIVFANKPSIKSDYRKDEMTYQPDPPGKWIRSDANCLEQSVGIFTTH